MAIVNGNCGTYPPFIGNNGRLKPLKRFNGVYLLEMGRREAPENSRDWVLKQLKIGAVKASLIGELLSANEDYVAQERESLHQGVFHDAPSNHAILPRFIKPFHGGNYWWYGGNRYFLTSLIKGREADYRQTGDLQAAIRAMKTFHQFTEKLIARDPCRWVFLKFDIKAEWRRRIREMEVCRDIAIRTRDDWSRQYLKDWRQFYDEAWKAFYRLKHGERSCANASAWVREVVCYHDWAYHNVIIQEDSACLIDFDYIIIDQPVHDKVNLIGRYLRLHRWSPESFFKIIWNFHRYYGWRNGELYWLETFLRFPYDYWILGRQYFIEKQPWSRRYYQEQWDRKIDCQPERNRILNLIKLISE